MSGEGLRSGGSGTRVGGLFGEGVVDGGAVGDECGGFRRVRLSGLVVLSSLVSLFASLASLSSVIRRGGGARAVAVCRADRDLSK